MIACILRGPGAEQSVVDRAIDVLKQRGVEAVETDRDAPEDKTTDRRKACGLVVTLGGDGTFLAGARFAAPKGIPLLGVNLGRLGFLTEVEAEHLEDGLTRFLDGDYRIEERTILQVVLSRGTRTVARAIGLNEVVVDHSGEARMLRVEIDVGGQAVGVIDADGVMVATATGSTAYALASGGPILEPTLRDLVLVPMNPFALTVRPIVFPPGQDIRLSVLRGPAEMRIDGRRGRAVATGDLVRCSSHPRRLKVVRFSPPEEFYRRLGEKLGWGRPLVPKVVLKELRVRDLALVAECRVRFGPGLNLLTGETGSGKSLIVDALSLALGARGGADQVRHGADKATVEGAFESDGVGMVLQRELGRRSSARIDGRPAPAEALRELGSTLVALHGQHEHHALLDSETQTDLLDGYAGAIEKRVAVAVAYAAWIEAGGKVRDLEQLRSRGQREQEYMRWQLEELRAADPHPGEDERLAAERAAARHAARLAELGQQAIDALHEDGAARAAAAIRSAADLDPRLADQASRLEALAEESSDSAAEIRRYGEALDTDPTRLETIESRLAVLDGIKRKYGGTLESAVEELSRLEVQIGATQDLEGALTAAQAEREARRATLDTRGAALTEARKGAARRMQKAVAHELEGLRLEGARFDIDLRAVPEIGPTGAEGAEMMFSANPGEPMQPLARVASGGELARVMLAIKTVGADADRLPTLVFDEVDAGIGGEAAVQVGLRLKALGSRHQVLVVTHLAQIAAFADHHLLVEKSPGPDGRNVVSVRELKSDDERARELARMMSGGVTPKAVARAHELLDESRSGSTK